MGWGIPKFALVAEVGVTLGILELCLYCYMFSNLASPFLFSYLLNTKGISLFKGYFDGYSDL